LAFGASLVLCGCATTPPPRPYRPPNPSQYRPYARAPQLRARAPPPSLASLYPLSDLKDWREDDHVQALAAYRLGCGVSRDPTAEIVCARAKALGPADETTARRFFEANFRAQILPTAGLLTAYFAPEYPARHTPDAEFSAALRAKPEDLVLLDAGPGDPADRKIPRLALDGALSPYPNRTDIELLPPAEPLAWMRPEDLFFMQIQGSGGVVFPDGTRMKALYAADNGQPFQPIAPEMVRRGLLAPNHASGDAIRRWLADHRGPQAQTIMDLDPRYIFFKLVPDDGGQPIGGAGLPLPPGRSIAIDTAWRAYGDLYWIEATSPILSGAMKSYRRLVMALDTGSAIKGAVRADLYLGRGAAAGSEAGRVRHILTLVKLVPLAQPILPLDVQNTDAVDGKSGPSG
jgi:membrane-bound lytic murein transglycosylase A